MNRRTFFATLLAAPVAAIAALRAKSDPRVLATISGGETTLHPCAPPPSRLRWLRRGHKYEWYDSSAAVRRGTVVVEDE